VLRTKKKKKRKAFGTVQISISVALSPPPLHPGELVNHLNVKHAKQGISEYFYVCFAFILINSNPLSVYEIHSLLMSFISKEVA